MSQATIALCWENDGIFETLGENYSLDAFGGVCPTVGDLIPAKAQAGGGQPKTNNGEVYQVLYRYFVPAPKAETSGMIYLVVQLRAAEEREINIIG